jgi:hypothetical protein
MACIHGILSKGTEIEPVSILNSSIMKQSNHAETPKNQGVSDQNKKAEKTQQNGKNESRDQHPQSGRGNQEQSGKPKEDTTNGIKDKQGNRK